MGDLARDITAGHRDSDIMAAIAGGAARTEHIADRFGYLRLRQQVYRRLVSLEKAGRVQRDPRYSARNSIYWRLPTPSPTGETE